MKTFIKMFTDSAKEFKNLRSVVAVALLIALHTVMALFLSIQVTTSLRVSISFLANVMVGCMYGPVMGFVAGGLGDLIQFIIKPTGPYFIGWTISAALAGLIYGCFFYGKAPKLTEKAERSRKEAVKELKRDDRMEKLLNAAAATLMAVSGAVLIMVPFLQVTKKAADGGTATLRGTASTLLFSGIAGNGSTNAMILAIISFAVCIFLLVTPWLKWYKTSMTVSVIAASLMILSVYTDKKTTTGLTGFWVTMILLILYAVVQLAQITKKHSMDFSFMIRCVIALTFDTVLINILLGTYWVSFMYGKGFAFYLTTRLVKNLVQLPINIMLTYYVLGMIKKVRIHK